MRNRFPPPSSFQQLRESGTLRVEIVQNLYESIATRIQAVLQADGVPTPY